MVTTEELEATFRKVGNDFGLGDVTAEFAPFRDLKLRWKRTISWAEFSVSDYLAEAPMEVVEGIAKTVMSKIRGEPDVSYPEETEQWLMSEEFRELNQDTYIARSRSVDTESENDPVLMRSYGRLLEKGLIGEIEGLKLFWSEKPSEEKSGQSSCLMRVVIMNSRLKEDGVPEEVIDYCLLGQLANIRIGFGLDPAERNIRIADLIKSFAASEETIRWLEDSRMEI